MGRKQLDRDVNEPFVQEADDQTSLTSHCCMDGIACEKVAEDRVLAICGAAADLIAGIDVAHHYGYSLRFEICFDAFAQIEPDVLELDISRGVSRLRICQ